ncbi:MAG: hypothetical protein ACTMIE_11960, partial [Cellulosimicrobium funkei]
MQARRGRFSAGTTGVAAAAALVMLLPLGGGGERGDDRGGGQGHGNDRARNVIFIQGDGLGLSHRELVRLATVGTDGQLAMDSLVH